MFRNLLAPLMFTMFTTPSHSLSHGEPLLLDFGRNSIRNWGPVNDDVMGGLSRCSIRYGNDGLNWTGRISLENNGGFSSVRSPWGTWDLSGYGEVTIRCRSTEGETQGFNLIMESSRQWFMPFWKGTFEATPEWKEITIPFDAFGKIGAVTGELSERWIWGSISTVQRIGIMKYDGRAGDFGLEVDWIRFNRPEEVRK